MSRVLVHAGFHKTGTSTVQQTLRLNKALLKPQLKVVLRPGMVAACEAARAFSDGHDPLHLALFRYEIAQVLDGGRRKDTRPVLLCSEDLCGHMPGRRGLKSYAAAPILMQTLAHTIEQVRPGTEVQFFLSTRAEPAWLASCHAQHLQASRITQDLPDYAHSHRHSARLRLIVDQVANLVAPAKVHSAALEDSQNRPLGPLDPILDLLRLPDDLRAQLVAAPPANSAPRQAVLDQLLALNQSDLADRDLRTAKQALLKGAA